MPRLGSRCVASPSGLMLVCVQDAAIRLAWLVHAEPGAACAHLGFAKSSPCEHRTIELFDLEGILKDHLIQL